MVARYRFARQAWDKGKRLRRSDNATAQPFYDDILSVSF